MIIIFIIVLLIIAILLICLLCNKKSINISKKNSKMKTKTIYFKKDINDLLLAKDLLESVVGIRVLEINSKYANLIILNKYENNKNNEIELIKKSLKKANIEIK